MKNTVSCLLGLALYAVVAFALVLVVERRIGERGPAIAAGLIAGAFVTGALSHLLTFGRTLRELSLIRSAQAGAEPQDGKWFAAIGPLTPDRGAGALSGSIRSGVQQIRVVAASDTKNPQRVARDVDPVCAIGRYSVDRRALILERAPEPANGLVARRVRALGGALMNAAVMLAIVSAALTALFAIVPLDFAESKMASLQPSWLEIGAEDWVEQHVRIPLHQAGMPTFIEPAPGAALEAGQARGRMRSGEKEVEVTRATVDWWHDHLAIRFYGESEFAGGIMVGPGGVFRGLNILSRDVDAETAGQAKLLIRAIEPDQIAGRVTLVKDNVPLCRVVFRVRVLQP